MISYQQFVELNRVRQNTISHNRSARLKGGTIIEVPPKPKRPEAYEITGHDGTYEGTEIGTRQEITDNLTAAGMTGFTLKRTEIARW